MKAQGKRFVLGTKLNRKVYNGSVTLEFVGKGKPVFDGVALEERARGIVLQWQGAWFRRAGNRVFVTVPPTGVLEFR